MCDHTNEPGGREAAMTVIERDQEGTPRVWCDPCLAPLVSALNNAGIRTIASCCGHGRNDPSVALADGRWVTLATDAPIAYGHRAESPDVNDESVPCPECGEPRPFGLDFLCLDCNGVRYVSENDWHAHHGCGFEEEWKYQREAREAITEHLASCDWAEPQGEPSDAQVDSIAAAIANAANSDYWVDEIAHWEGAEEWYREAYPGEHPHAAYEDREGFRKQARAALRAAGAGGVR